MIHASCPHCRNAYKLPDCQLGRRVRCRSCMETFLVKAPEEAAPADPVAEPPIPNDFRTASSQLPAPPSASADHDDRPSRRQRVDDDRPSRRLRPDDDYADAERARSNVVLILVSGGAALLVLLMCGGGLAWHLASSSSTPSTPVTISSTAGSGGEANPNPGPAVNPGGGGEGRIPFRPLPNSGDPPPPPRSSVPDAKNVESALAMLKDLNADVRRTGLNFLKRLPFFERDRNRDAVGKAVAPLLDDDELGKDANELLRSWRCKEIVPRLELELARDNPSNLNEVFRILGEIKCDEAAELLAKQLVVKGRAAYARGPLQQQGKRAEKYIVKYIHHADKSIRQDVRDILTSIGTSSAALVQQAVNDLDAKELESRRAALETLSKEKVPLRYRAKVAKAAAPSLNSTDVEVRRMAIAALVESAGEEQVKSINIALGDRDAQVREKALEIIGRLKSEESIGPLVTYLLAAPPNEQETALKLVVAYGEKAEKTVQVLLTSANANVRKAGLQLLAEVGTKDSLPALQKMAKADTGNKALITLVIKKIREREKTKTPRD
jgi:HEAT repeat protein